MTTIHDLEDALGYVYKENDKTEVDARKFVIAFKKLVSAMFDSADDLLTDEVQAAVSQIINNDGDITNITNITNVNASGISAVVAAVAVNSGLISANSAIRLTRGWVASSFYNVASFYDVNGFYAVWDNLKDRSGYFSTVAASNTLNYSGPAGVRVKVNCSVEKTSLATTKNITFRVEVGNVTLGGNRLTLGWHETTATLTDKHMLSGTSYFVTDTTDYLTVQCLTSDGAPSTAIFNCSIELYNDEVQPE